MGKTRTVRQKWLVDELVLFLYYKKKCAKTQSNPRIFSKVIVFVDIGVKTVFSHSRGLKTWRFDENWESDFSHKTNTFSYDENVKIILK